MDGQIMNFEASLYAYHAPALMEAATPLQASQS